MSSVRETAYPRFKPDLTELELAEIYTPSEEELAFARQHVRRSMDFLVLLVLLKTGQRLGYFVNIAEVPADIVTHIAKCGDVQNVGKKKMLRLSKAGTGQRLRNLAMNYLCLKPFHADCERLVSQIAEDAAQTKQELADIINVVIEELVRQRFELPGFSTLLRSARRARLVVNDRLYRSIQESLSEEMRTELDALLKVCDVKVSEWQKLKQEPKKPTNKEIRKYLKHIVWLKTWVNRLPGVAHISAAKWRQLKLEARALDAADLRKIKPSKRYALIVILGHSQLRRTMDDAVSILVRKMNSLHSRASQKLQQDYLERSQKTESLISQFRDVLGALSKEESDAATIAGIKDALLDNPEKLTIDCDEHLAYAGNNYVPFMLGFYRTHRLLMINYLEILNVQSSSNDQSIVQAVEFICRHRNSHKTNLELNGQELDLSWLSDRWRKVVTGKSSVSTSVKEIHRLYFELCVLSQVIAELKSGDLFVEQSEQYSDYRDQLISWSQYEKMVEKYGELVDLPTNPGEFIDNLSKELSDTANKIDSQFPKNDLVKFNDDHELVILKHKKSQQPEGLSKAESAITERLPEISILDVLVETETWLDLYTGFGPVSGYESKIDNPRKRFVTTLFCYGCNLGPLQTARSVKDLSRKQVAWLNLRHVTEERLEEATERVINAYNQFKLPKYWGTGKHASADGTKWNVYEQNLLSEYHIRYGGYGGIGYYHVSDMYIALFSHFIPCGVYEAVYILDGLIKNDSDIQPDTIHGDTQSQNAPVFGLSCLLGINLMPRIRGLKKLAFFRPNRAAHYHHIDQLFSESINWKLIETHFCDMLRIVLSIKAGKITPSTILKRLGTKSRKNKLYFAFRELGRAVRTIFLLKYIGDVEIRKTVQAATNKSEEFNHFAKWLFFGSEGVVADNVRHEQRKIIKYNHLVANMVILHNVEGMTRVLKEMQADGIEITQEILAALSPYRTHHINRFGDYTLDLESEVRPMIFETEILA